MVLRKAFNIQTTGDEVKIVVIKHQLVHFALDASSAESHLVAFVTHKVGTIFSIDNWIKRN